MSDRQLTARGRERRDELLNYAIRRFAENGYHPTSVADIVDGVGVGKGVFYWYFPSKDELLLEILRQALVDLRTCQQRALVGANDPLTRIERGVRSGLLWSWANVDIMRLVLFARTEESFAAALDKGRRIMVADTERHVADAIDQGLIASGDPTVLATAVHAVTDELGRRFPPTPGEAPSEDVIEAAIRMCLAGLVGAERPGSGSDGAEIGECPT
jgi:AcrR family transcriptional regulator